jgi:hypothetical protein
LLTIIERLNNKVLYDWWTQHVFNMNEWSESWKIRKKKVYQFIHHFFTLIECLLILCQKRLKTKVISNVDVLIHFVINFCGVHASLTLLSTAAANCEILTMKMWKFPLIFKELTQRHSTVMHKHTSTHIYEEMR